MSPAIASARWKWNRRSSITRRSPKRRWSGKAHELKGQALAAFVTLREGTKPTSELNAELREHVANKIGAIAKPDDIIFSADLPKTRSGKIMRRLLRDIAEGRTLGDTTTLADPAVVAALRDQYEAIES